MILTVTLNPALDLTYTVDALVPHGTHRVAAVAERPGGKGLNVATVLHALGEPVLATGLLGGATGGRIAELLDADGVPARFCPIVGETRRTVAVADRDDATGFWEPGPWIAEREWAAFVAHFRELLGTASVVALCGSLPPGVPLDGYATLIRAAAQAGVRTVLDSSGEALRRGLAAAPDLAKPNAEELCALIAGDRLDRGPRDHDHVDREWIRALGVPAVVVSRGPAGLLACTDGGDWQAAPPGRLAGNPTGAGDACVAALARGLRDATPWPGLLADAVALSAAAVVAPTAGTFDHHTYRRLRDTVQVRPA